MIIHFITAESKLTENIDIARNIVRIVHKDGHSLARDWVEPAHIRRIQGIEYSNKDWATIYKESIAGISKAEMIIAEVSNESLSLGYQISVALRQKKPTLLLRSDRANSDMFVTGIKEPHIFQATYSSNEELEGHIKKFIQDNDIKQRDMRFNFFIDRKIHNYLRYQSFKTGKTKAEVIRELLKKDIKKADQV